MRERERERERKVVKVASTNLKEFSSEKKYPHGVLRLPDEK